jgi:hypothetical protein
MAPVHIANVVTETDLYKIEFLHGSVDFTVLPCLEMFKI